MSTEQSSLLLRRQLKGLYMMSILLELNKNPVDGFSAGLVDANNIYEVVHILYL